MFCNGKAIFRGLNLERESGKNRPTIKKASGLVPNAQGKLLLEFVPLSHYANLSAIEVLPQSPPPPVFFTKVPLFTIP